jgi:hypothetical protein
MSDLSIKAGSKAYQIIKDGGFNFNRIATYVAPAGGPRWLAASGFDIALMENDVLGLSRPVLLSGTSSGAWRLAAWLQPEPLKSYRNFVEAYLKMSSYQRSDTPGSLLESMGRVIDDYIEDDAIPFALANRKYRLAVTTARAKHLAASETDWIQRLGLGLAWLSNAVSPAYLRLFFERVVFFYGALAPRFCLKPGFRGKAIPLSAINFKAAVLASGAIPIVIAGLRDIYGAPRGIYRDGGVFDYHLNHEYAKDEEVTLFFNYGERVVPGWLDKKLKSRRPPAQILKNVLMVYPASDFAARLPGGKVPDREDFITYIDDPETRMMNWRRAVELCAPLGEQFLETAASGRIRDVVEKLE